MMYTGQEVGFNHPFEFFELDTVQPDYTANQFTAFYRMLNALKHSNPALDAGIDGGSFEVIPAGDSDILAFERAKDGRKVIVVANLSGEAKKLAFPVAPDVVGMTDWFTGRSAAIPAALQPWEYFVVVK